MAEVNQPMIVHARFLTNQFMASPGFFSMILLDSFYWASATTLGTTDNIHEDTLAQLLLIS